MKLTAASALSKLSLHQNKTMKKSVCSGHKWNIADSITLCRIVGTIVLVFLQPLSAAFFCLYALTGVTDVLDGWIARKTKTASDFGAKLDSVADLLFYTLMLLRVFPILWSTLPGIIWYAVAAIILIRLSAYLAAAVKYRRFASVHTYLNKLTGGMVFFVPFLLVTQFAEGFCWAVCAIGAAGSLEELVIHIRGKTYRPDVKSIFLK